MGTDAAAVRYLTPRDAAERLLISEYAVRRAISRGELRAIKVCRRVRIAEEDFEEWLEASRIEPIERLEPPAHGPVPGHGLRGVLQELRS